MMTQIKGFHIVQRPEGIVSQFELVVVDGKGHPHLALTRCYQQFRQELSDGTARTYLMALLHCKVRRYGMYEMVALSAQSPSTVRVFLSALKRFYSSALFASEYPHAHPLTNPVVHLLQEIDQEDVDVRRARPKMPPESGIEEPQRKRSSDDYFRLVDKKWIPEPIADPALHLRLITGFEHAKVSRRDQIVIHIAYESGARITELLTLTVGDWRKSGAGREATACNKGSHGCYGNLHWP